MRNKIKIFSGEKMTDVVVIGAGVIGGAVARKLTEYKLNVCIVEKCSDVDGVFVSGYTLSQVFYNSAIEQGRRIPDDLQIVSYDGIFKQWSSSHMTSVEQPIEEMARAVVRLLIKKIHGESTPSRTVLETKFVLGTTTK